MSFWESAFSFVQLYLCPAAFFAVIAAVVLLILRRKKNGVRPPHARKYLTFAVCLFIFAALTLLAFIVCFAAIVIKFGLAIAFAGLKSL